MIKKKEYYAHYNNRLHKVSQKKHTYIVELSFNEWFDLYLKDKEHWFKSRQFNNEFQSFAYNPIYSKLNQITPNELIYEDFIIIFSSFKDYKQYVKKIDQFYIKQNSAKEFLNEMIQKPEKLTSAAYDILSMRVEAITKPWV